MTDDAPFPRDHDDVHTMPPEPCSLVETVRGRPRQADPPGELEVGALRRGASEWQLEQHRLADGERAEADEPGRDAQLEAAPPSGAGDDSERRLGFADAREQNARVERIEA